MSILNNPRYILSRMYPNSIRPFETSDNTLNPSVLIQYQTGNSLSPIISKIYINKNDLTITDCNCVKNKTCGEDNE